MRLNLALGLILTAATTAATAGVVEDQIRFRQSAYSFMGWNTAKIKSQVVDHPESYNKYQIIAAANVIAAVANSGDGTTFWPLTPLRLEDFAIKMSTKQSIT